MMTIAKDSDRRHHANHRRGAEDEKQGGDAERHGEAMAAKYGNGSRPNLPDSYFLSTTEWLAMYRGL